MALIQTGGYMGDVLRVDLTSENITCESFEEKLSKKYIGGVGMGVKFLYDEVGPGTSWFDKDNRLIFAAGPLNGTTIPGSGTVCAVTKGCLTDGGASSQANGYFGAFLKACGLDALIVQGAASEWKYLYIHDGTLELKDAYHLIGKDTIETEKRIQKELGKQATEISIYSIGPAGENLVKYAMLFGDRGHVLAHNGLGTVMGSKKLKAIAVDRGSHKTPVRDRQNLLALSKRMSAQAKAHPIYGQIHKYGTSMLWPMLVQNGMLPVRNLTTNLFPNYENFSREYYGNLYEMKRIGCWACPLHHVQYLKIKKGPYGALEAKDPEYECTASWSALIGNEDFESAVMLSDLTDRLGMDSNEAGWTIAFAIECYEKGILTQNDTDGLLMTWGNVEAVKAMLMNIARRKGFGDILAEGVMRAADHIGGDALKLGVYVMKGHSPRTHDARARWSDILDYSTSGVGTSESNPVPSDKPFLPKNVAWSVKQGKIREFVDSLVVCNLVTMTYMGAEITHLVEALNLVTGWDYTDQQAIEMSERIANLFRAFNIKHGHMPSQELPSIKYGSVPVDGPMKGKNIMAHWAEMRDKYYELMGWDKQTGKPLPETLEKLGLGFVISDIW